MNWRKAALEVAFLYRIGPRDLWRMTVPEIIEWHDNAKRMMET